MEAIAIIGLAAQLPQDATSSEQFWELIREGRQTASEIPNDRIHIDAFYHPDSGRSDTTNVRQGNFLRGNVAAFDAPFFSIQPAEAESMDPQQRLLLETTYQALEDAGIPMEQTTGSRAGVFFAASTRDYEVMLYRDVEQMPKYMGTGIGTALLANRVSWFFDLRGPSITIDTACSGSLTAIHLACQSLRSGECDMALAGGGSLVLTPEVAMSQLSTLGFLSPDGRSYSFDARANGYAKGEGLGMVVLKRVNDAIRDGDTIRAVVRATAINQDGRTPGITQPSQKAQTDNILSAYQTAGLSLDATVYFEAHGTGTAVGDPIEAAGLHAAFRRSRENPLYVGALKANIGHLEAAAGIAATIKTVLMLEHGIIPPIAGLGQPNPNIPIEEWNLKLPSQAMPFPDGNPRRVSINSFGYGGTNAHAIMDDAESFLEHHGRGGKHATVKATPHLLNGQGTSLTTKGSAQWSTANGVHRVLNGNGHAFQPPLYPQVVLLSAADEAGIQRLAAAYERHLQRMPRLDPVAESRYLSNLTYTLSSRRSNLPWKGFAVAQTLSELKTQWTSTLSKPVRSGSPPAISYIFTGQGAQWPGMTKGLDIYPIFEESLHRSQECLERCGCDWNLIDEFSKNSQVSRVDEPEFAQPLCTALQIALVDLLASWELQPAAVVGHSSGEIAAAYCVGALSHEAAIQVAYHRGRAASRLAASRPGQGGMMAVALSAESVTPHLVSAMERAGGLITVGCVNAPTNVTITGDAKPLEALQQDLDGKGIFARRLQVNAAYHSHHMDELADSYRQSLQGMSAKEVPASMPRSVMFSSVTGERAGCNELARPDYWVRNLLGKVQFATSLTRMVEYSIKEREVRGQSGHGVLLEVGPHPALQRPIRDTVQHISGARQFDYNPTLARDSDPILSLANSIGRLRCWGCTIDLAKVGSPQTPIGELQGLSGLPAYEFNHSRSYWTESRISKGLRFREQRRHELLGVRESDWNPLQPKWRNLIRLSEHQWIPDHRFGEQQLYPAAGMIVMVIEACRQLVGPGLCPAGYQFHDITFPTGFAVPLGADTVEAQLHFDPYKSTQGSQVTRWDFQIFAWVNNAWTAVCRGTIALDWAPKRSRSFDEERLKSLDLEELSHSQTGQHWAKVPSDQFYENLSACGQNFGPTFQTLRDLRIGEDGQATVLVVLDSWNEKVEGQPKIAHHVIHPTDLDGILQAGVAAYSHGGHRTIPVLLPTRVQALWISHDLIDRKPHQEMRILARTAFQGYREADFVIGAVDMENKVQLLVEGFRQTALNGPDSDADQNPVRSCFTVDWRPDIDLLLPSEIEDLCRKAVDPRTMVAGGEVDRQELVSQFYLRRALQTVSPGQIEGLPSHLRKYMSWVHHAFDSEQFERLLEAHPALVADEVSQDEFLSQVAEESVASKIIVTTGRNFGAIIRGELDPLELFMGDEKLLEEFYTGASFETCFAQLTTYIDLMAYKSPALNILEVGAGTGAMTRRILERLTHYTSRTDDRADIPRLQSYTFTDISPGFFEEAKEKLEAFSDRMEYAVFNLEKCPQEQGFKMGQYDMVVASLVLHATSNLGQTLQRIRTLLKPNGKLVVLEPTAPEKARMSFFFGLLPGWWLGEEQERELCPLLDEAGWHQILQETGFSGMDVKLPDHNDISMRSFTGFVSTATEFQSELSACEDPPSIVVIASEKSKTQNHLAQEVKEVLEREALDVSVLSPKKTVAIDLHHCQCISLLETDTSFFESIGDEDWAWFKNMLSNAQGFLWVTRGGTLSESTPSRALVKGLGRAIRSENIDAHFIELALQSETAEERAVSHIVRVYRQSLHPHEGQRESEFIEHDGHLCIGRVAEATSLNWKLHQAMGHRHPKPQAYGSRQNRALKLTIGTPGLLETLCFDDELNETPLGPEDVEIDVKAVGGSLQDALVVTGQASSSVLGQECSGVVTRSGPQSGYQAGDRVAACTRSGAYKSLVRTDASAVMRVPEGMTLITAATIPSAFATAYYSLVMLANIQQGESVLIHSGASDVGQAAIQVAQKHGARVFTTVGVAECRRFLTDTYQIPDENILSIQDSDLTIKILAMTGTGVGVVFGSHGSESRQASWACIAPLGRFLELAANQMNPSTEGVPTGPLAKGISLHSVCLEVIMGGSKPLMRRIMDGVAQLFTGDNATLAPKPVHLYSLTQTESAFRFILEDKSYGKVVVEMRPEDEVPVLPSSLPSYYFEDQATYVIVGGLGGLGQQMVRWMVQRRARHFLLLSRSGSEGNEAARDLMEEMAAKRVRILAPRCDVTDEGCVAATIEKCASTMPPIKGCIQGAMVLRDGLLESTSTGDIHAVLRPKTVGTLNLVRHLPHDLDFLVLLSSVSGMTGSRGQANYAMANTFQDGLARRLAAEGRACLSLNLGSILSVGFAAEHDLTAALRRDGFVGLPVATFLGLLDWACDPTNQTARDPMTAQLVSGLAGAQCLDPDHFRGVYWASKPMFRPLLQLSTAAVRNDPTDAKVPAKNNFTAQIANAEDASGLFEVALAALTDRLARLLAVPVEDIDPKRPVTAFGIDSLIGLELRQWAKKELKADITVLDIMQTKSVEALVEIIVGKYSRQASGFRPDTA